MDDIGYLHQHFDSPPSFTWKDCSLIILEDDRALATILKKYLVRTLAMPVHAFEDYAQLNEFLKNTYSKNNPFCFLTDLSLGQGTDGLGVIDRLKDEGYCFVSIAMTGFGSIESAISATKKGVFHYLTKPFDLEILPRLISEAFAKKLQIVSTSSDLSPQQKKEDVRALLPTYDEDRDSFYGMVTQSPSMKRIFEQIKKVARSNSTVLITGASGTGKELVAQAIHSLSERAHRPMVSVNCGAIPGELLESELFGHIKGAFTGAISNRQGKFEASHHSSLFLDEIGDMPLLLQVKILRLLQSRVFERVGENLPIHVDTRLIAATHRNLEKSVQEGRFREDLYYRLNVIPIKIPALKERREDIPLLISYFMQKFSSADGRNKVSFTEDSLRYLMAYDWPGNIRELENLIERLVILRGGNQIHPDDLPPKIYNNPTLAPANFSEILPLPDSGIDLKNILEEIENSLIIQALKKTSGNKNQASKLLNLNRTTLIEKLKKKNLDLAKEAFRLS